MEHLHQLNPEQLQAVAIVDGPALVLAGAGSGKTRVVTARIIHLIQSGLDPSQILGLTFTNKAAQEMKERVSRLTQSYVTISTFHSLGAKILRESIQAMGYGPGFAIYDEDDSNKMLAQCLEEVGIQEKKGDLRIWRSGISKAKNDLKDPDEMSLEELPDSHQLLFPRVYRSYQARLKESNAVDFDDLLFLPVKLLKEFPEVKKYYQTRWTHLLIDEYQDTNEAQYTFVKLLVEQSMNIFVVGDPDQAIYSWRGANIGNILNFERDFAGARVILLEQNYRSRATILQASNALISQNEARYEKKLWSDRGEGAKIGRYSAYNEREEARFVASKIRQHLQKEAIPLNQMVVFYRTNAQSRAFEDQFLAQGLPYVIVGGISFYQRREIKDILSLLRLALSDCDTAAFMRVLNVPKRGVGETTMNKLLTVAQSEGMPILAICKELLQREIQGVKLTGKAAFGVGAFLHLIENLRELAKDSSLELIVKAAIEKSGYLAYLKEEKETEEDRKENLDELIAKAIEWDLTHEKAELSAFLEELSLKSSLDESQEVTDRVSLMTVHNGKGLEFAVSFVAGLEEDLFPHANSRDSHEKLEEERRLCYVGMTRAKEYLYMTDSQVRYLWGTQRFQRPSRFLKEIPQEYFTRAIG
jgi:DNA helicase II / ATP-dependent DNA helicase PcrA